jgi:hypothetical protein
MRVCSTAFDGAIEPPDLEVSGPEPVGGAP